MRSSSTDQQEKERKLFVANVETGTNTHVAGYSTWNIFLKFYKML